MIWESLVTMTTKSITTMGFTNYASIFTRSKECIDIYYTMHDIRHRHPTQVIDGRHPQVIDMLHNLIILQ